MISDNLPSDVLRGSSKEPMCHVMGRPFEAANLCNFLKQRRGDILNVATALSSCQGPCTQLTQASAKP